ncbi:MAG: hypothetical protein ABEJ95_03085 [Candidatus Nanohalobium sp.]
MVVKEEYQGQETFKCEVCGFHYQEKSKAEECEEFCESGGCSSEITKHSIERS